MELAADEAAKGFAEAGVSESSACSASDDSLSPRLTLLGPGQQLLTLDAYFTPCLPKLFPAVTVLWTHTPLSKILSWTDY